MRVTRACVVEKALRDQRAAAAHVARELHLPAGHSEELDRRLTDLGLRIARERIGEEHHRASARLRQTPALPCAG